MDNELKEMNTTLQANLKKICHDSFTAMPLLETFYLISSVIFETEEIIVIHFLNSFFSPLLEFKKFF